MYPNLILCETRNYSNLKQNAKGKSSAKPAIVQIVQKKKKKHKHSETIAWQYQVPYRLHVFWRYNILLEVKEGI